MTQISETAFVHPGSVQIGRFAVGDYSSLWPGSVIRADFDRIEIGRFTSVQDNATLHAAPGAPVIVGSFVTVAHNAVLHGCRVEDDCLISMGAIVLDHVVIGSGSVVAAGAVVRERTVVPPGSLVVGVPARVNPGRPEQKEQARANGVYYAALARLYAEGLDVTSAAELMTKVEQLKALA